LRVNYRQGAGDLFGGVGLWGPEHELDQG